jgi:hypothetical protein
MRGMSGVKVLCRDRPSLKTPSGGAPLREEWVGTAPFCQGHPDDCAQRGMDYVRSDNRGDGAACVSGRKVLCRRRSQSQGSSCEGSGSGRSLLIVDWKSTSPDGAASRLFALIREHLTDHAPKLGILVTTARWDDHGRFAGLANLRPTEGVGIDEDNDPVRVSRYFHDLGLPHAYGNGVTAALPEGVFAPKVAGSVATALQLRRQNGLGRLVYVWTLADQTSMRNYLAIGVDAIFVNRAGVLAGLSDLLHVVRNSCFPVRIATSADRPFAPTTVRAAPVMPPRNVPARPAR